MPNTSVSVLAPTTLRSLALTTPMLDESTAFYAEHYGLTIGERSANRTTFAASNGQVALTLTRGATPSLDVLGFVFQSMDRLEAAMLAHEKANRMVERIANGFAIYDPAGLRLEFTHDPDCLVITARAEATDRPIHLSHIVLNARDPAAAIAFYENVVGLRVSDRYERDLLTFLRADQAQHHCIGIAKADVDGLNHFAMDCGNIDGVMRGMARLKQNGAAPIWGPGRHGPGGNIFCYFEDPDGFVAEYTCDVMQISDHDHRPQIWARTPENGNVWLTGPPTERGVALMAGQLQAEFRA
jgi:catechol 2,3-dioxygenase-like lactoylglutathione lyase family enzyme